MKALSILILFSLAAPVVSADDLLREADREALLERLEEIRNAADAKVDARFRAAIGAYRSAMASEDAAIDLYLKCEEMVSFEQQNKKSSDFRDWKRKNSDKLSDSDFKMALRQQLRWLVLTLEAASEDPDREKLAAEAGKVIESIMAQAEDLAAHRNVLQQSVTSSVFARAYEIESVKVEDWPLAPGQFQQIYEQVILPPLRRSDKLASLRAAWTKRIFHEGMMADLWSGKAGEKRKPGVKSPEYEKFIENTLPRRQWEAEVDLFKAGDERGAAVRMLAHIEKHLAHEAAPKWAGDFVALLQPEVEDVDPEEEDPAP